MHIVKYKNVFDHVAKTLTELFQNNPKYENICFVLGYNSWKNLDFVKVKYPNHKIIIIQLEQLNGTKWFNENTCNMLKNDAYAIWDYDINNIKFLNQHGIYPYHFPLPYTKSLHVLPEIDDKKIDVLFYGYLNQNRADILINIENKLGGCKVVSLFGVFGEELDNYISKSKIILNLHYYPVAIQEQVRMYYLAINNCCILSEPSAINYMGKSILESKPEHIVDTIKDILNTGKWLEQARNSSRIFQEITNSRDYSQLF